PAKGSSALGRDGSDRDSKCRWRWRSADTCCRRRRTAPRSPTGCHRRPPCTSAERAAVVAEVEAAVRLPLPVRAPEPVEPVLRPPRERLLQPPLRAGVAEVLSCPSWMTTLPHARHTARDCGRLAGRV